VGHGGIIALALPTFRRPPASPDRFEYRAHRETSCTADTDSRDPGREQFRSRLQQLLADKFPDEIVDSLATGADLHHSISGSYTRGVMHRGADAFAVLSAGPSEDSATIDGILTFGLIWLDLTRNRARRQSVRGLRLFLPRGTSAITAHRLTALASPQEIELYEYDSLHWRMRRVAISDAGNLETWLVSRREVDQALTALRKAVSLAPENPKAHRSLAKALDAKGLHQEAQEELRRAQRQPPP